MERTENAVELWAEEFSKKPIRPLTKEEKCFCSNKKTKRERVYQIYVNNLITAVTLDRMTAIKVRNLSQNNGYLARIEEVSEKDVDPDWREDVEELKKLKYEKCN